MKSRFKIGEEISSPFGSVKVSAVTFTESKVFYDLEFLKKPGQLSRVDSALL